MVSGALAFLVILACKVFQHLAAFLICLMVMMLAAAQKED
jgi:hypothetical protein